MSGDALDLSIGNNHILRISPSSNSTDAAILARFHKSDNTYEAETIGDSQIWVNGKLITSRLLEPGDLIEFGDNGPLCRFNLNHSGMRLRKTVADIITDCIDYAKVSRRPFLERFAKAVQNLLASLAKQTTRLFRLSIIASLILLSIVVYTQIRSSEQLRSQMVTDSNRLDEFAGVLARTQKEAVRPIDLNTMRQEFDQSIETASDRLTVLEDKSDAISRVIDAAAASIVFLQGSYVYREIGTGRMLKYVINEEGQPMISSRSQPLLTLEGDGPVAERNFTGTAFIISESGVLLTNRHVAMPWEQDTQIEIMRRRGMEPVMRKFIGYLSDSQSSFDVQLLKASDEADLAVLTCNDITQTVPPLTLSDSEPVQGDKVVVMGYPTGLRAMLAQTGKQFIDNLRKGEELDFWQIAKHLSKNNFINPLASQGIVAQITNAAVVYDAETTHGGSGGPVLDANGHVIAVNAAIIPDYTGSNIGVPIVFAKRLIHEAGLDLDTAQN